MKKTALALSLFSLIALAALATAPLGHASITMNYPAQTLQSNGTTDSGNFAEVWDLTLCDMVISFTYDANGLVDDSGTHAWAAFGVRAVGYGNFNPTWDVEGAGVWLATDYDWTANTFDETVTPTLDDKLILQKAGGHGEGDYNLPSVPPVPGNNHRVWWDRHGVGETAGTGGIYQIVITLHASSDTAGTAYMMIKGLYQGFEVDGNWNTIELTPAGMTFTGDMKQQQVYYGLYGYGAMHTVEFRDITVVGCPWVPSPVIPEVPYGTIMAFASMFIVLAGFIGFKRLKPRFR